MLNSQVRDDMLIRHAIQLRRLRLPLIAAAVFNLLLVLIVPAIVSEEEAVATQTEVPNQSEPTQEVTVEEPQNRPHQAWTKVEINDQPMLIFNPPVEAVTEHQPEAPVPTGSDASDAVASLPASDAIELEMELLNPSEQETQGSPSSVADIRAEPSSEPDILEETPYVNTGFQQIGLAIAQRSQFSTRGSGMFAAAANGLVEFASVEPTVAAEITADQPEFAAVAEPAEASEPAATPDLEEPPREPEPVTQLTSLAFSNPAESGGPVLFLVDGDLITLEPGAAHRLASGGHRVVRFHRGGDFGDAQIELVEGSYRFIVADGGWDLKPTEL